jgi:hypothetical protein
MSKRPVINVGAGAASPTSSLKGRALPAVDVNPDTNTATAALVDGAAVHSSEPVKTVIKPDPMKEPPAERFLPKFSLSGEAVETLDQVRRRFRITSGDEENMSRVVEAAIMNLACQPDQQLVEIVRQIPLRKAGRRPGKR